MKHLYNIKICIALLALFGIICLASFPAMADDCGGISCSCIGCDSPPPSYSPPEYNEPAPEHDDSAERAELNARLDAVIAEAMAAYKRADYREALRLFREQQQLRDGPNVQQNIAFAQEMIVRVEREQQAERERIDREAQQRVIDEQNRIAKEKEDIETASKIRNKLDTFAESLDSAPPKAGVVIPKTDIAVDDGLGTHKAYVPPLKFGSPDDLEALSEQGRQGFDIGGFFKGKKTTPAATADPKVYDPIKSDSRMIAIDKELTILAAERVQIDIDIDKIVKERSTEFNPEKMKKLTKELDEKYAAKAGKLLDIYNKEEKKDKLHREINTEVGAKKEKSK